MIQVLRRAHCRGTAAAALTQQLWARIRRGVEAGGGGGGGKSIGGSSGSIGSAAAFRVGTFSKSTACRMATKTLS